MLTQEQIKSVLGSGRKVERVLSDEDKITILSMCESGCKLSEIVSTLQETNEKVKRDHVKNYLTRKLNKLNKLNKEEK